MKKGLCNNEAIYKESTLEPFLWNILETVIIIQIEGINGNLRTISGSTPVLKDIT